MIFFNESACTDPGYPTGWSLKIIGREVLLRIIALSLNGGTFVLLSRVNMRILIPTTLWINLIYGACACELFALLFILNFIY